MDVLRSMLDVLRAGAASIWLHTWFSVVTSMGWVSKVDSNGTKQITRPCCGVARSKKATASWAMLVERSMIEVQCL